ncbi:MarR family winged helix-turn-helix transcriptional regulator [Gordonia hankookensis]|uniref:MarR family transcriptional regulator n=1 Tax=Gordonia hankookensis TaxID=589403 RepID=A0ABR7WCA9_9ACTN|nr:MarR family transcriptional regulator [Gordonia hankookensis]MBD1320437.1 MarR family transcriptional regulator [Gordonia hankookensis]
MQTNGRPGPRDRLDGPTASDVDTLQLATRDLVGIALRSVAATTGDVSLAQFRMLWTLAVIGPSSSAQVANALGVGASSVTRLADRLQHSGYLERGSEPTNRRVVTLDLTTAGHELVKRVLQWRKDELTRILSLLGPDVRAGLVDGLHAMHQGVGEEYASETGPLPL